MDAVSFVLQVCTLAALGVLLIDVHHMEVTLTKELDAVKVQMARMQAAVAKEIQQLADALANSNQGDPPAEIQAVADQLRALADNLEADDPAPAPAPEPAP